MSDAIREFIRRHGLSTAQAVGLEELVQAEAWRLASPLVGESVLEGFLQEALAPEAAPAMPERYTFQARIGQGGVGEVWRVFDGLLERPMAMKILRPSLESSLQEAFIEEAKITAQLEHPGIIPVHDMGTLPDGRRYFTMKEVTGQVLETTIEAVHRASPPDRWGFTAEGLGLRRLVTILLRVCEATAYAHVQAVSHRDLKPQNIMIGDFGEVLVLDWGLAARMAPGEVYGTPAYMAPEQLHPGEVGREADVYALGAILFTMLTGGAPYTGPSMLVLAQRRAGQPPAPLTSTRPLPLELCAICTHAMQPDPADRYPTAAAMGEQIAAWLEGARLRERALAVVARAQKLRPRIAALLVQSEEKRQAGRALLRRLPPFAPVDAKRPGWVLEDEAAAHLRQAEQLTIEQLQLYQAAFTHQPDLPEAHAALAEHHRERHAAAEARGATAAAARHEQLLRQHDRRGVHAAYLSGEAAVWLSTEPAGAAVELHRLHTVDRRLVPRLERTVTAPLVGLSLPHGRWMAVLRHRRCHPVRVLLPLPRAGRWHNRARPEEPDRPIALPRAGAVGAAECLIPAGASVCGGDPDAYSPLPAQRVWLERFVIQRHPVTNRQYIAFLDDLLDQGRERDALRHAPRERGGRRDALGALLYGRDAGGRFVLQTDAEGHQWLPDWPVFCIDWHSACAYADWLAAKSGLPWRLPTELEWEKAAGGGDGRRFPWGDFLDPTWCCVRRSHAGVPLVAEIHQHPGDESPYAVMGCAGNVRDWCADFFHPEGLPVTPEDPSDPALQRVVRGGSWFFLDDSARVSSRFGLAQRRQSDNVGVRLVRSY